MEVKFVEESGVVTAAIEGRVDSVTAPELDKALSPYLKAKELVLNFEKVEYISSAGLRVILAASKALNGHGSLKIVKASPLIAEIFDMTGFSEVIDIE